jgi:WD40 repeat protein
LFAFVTDRSGSVEIWARSRDGLWERPIVTAVDFGASRTDTLASLAFSPDGRTLAYQRGAGGTFEVWLSPATGGTPVRVSSTGQSGGRVYEDAPTWSADGEWIAYVRSDSKGRTTLAKTRVGANDTAELLEGATVFSRPAWSPDGKWIACMTDSGLVRVPATGGKAQPLTDIPILALTWRPDGRAVAALTESETPGHFAIVDIDATTGDIRTLNPDLGPIPIAIQSIRGFSLLSGQGFLTSLASARSDIWLIDGVQPRRGWLTGLFGRFR